MASKSKKGQKQKQKLAPLRGNHTVRECMTWHYQKGYVAEENQEAEPREHYLPRKGEIGRAKSRGYETDNTQGHVIQMRADDGTVIEALRGWPHDRKPEDGEYGNYGDNQLPPIDTEGQGQSDKVDPWMTDLISHRFLNDAIRRRQQEEEDELNRAAAARGKKSGPGKGDIKGNRTSQLRSIALAQKVEVNPHDLWQMPRFKNNAKAHLTTTQTKQKKQKGGNEGVGSGRAGSGRVGSGRGDPCVCDNYKDDIVDYREQSYSPKNDYDYGQVNGGGVDPVFQNDYNGQELFAV